MPSLYVANTIDAYLQANWTETRIIDVENLFQNPNDGQTNLVEWITMQSFIPSIEEPISSGTFDSLRRREEGVLRFTAYVPSGSGTARVRTLADQLHKMFRSGKQINDGAGGPSICFEATSPPDLNNPSRVQSSNGNWYGVFIDAEYRVDFCN